MATQSEARRAPPRHVAIIMDGNGRWAAARGKPRAFGHRQGVEAVRGAVRAAGDLGLTHLTLFGFSTENWRRPAEEVDALFALLKRFVAADLDRLVAEGVRVRVIGRREGLSADILDIIRDAESRTAENTRFNLTIAFNYGGRDEIVRAAVRAAADGGDLADLDEDGFAAHLDTASLPDPDMLIRTSGERRLSNFMLWQAAYAELIFMDVLWPDFSREHLEAAIEDYRGRERRYGGLSHV
ncbi:di-trans,poly-cis-decaprenylcistransferase [Marinicauda salina]|uniref:Isoprenyl transferase n=1 Tax=Marinicauda salina TaxID=2135793 RepID=A0A2U2BT99_9PROT|nr:polyprenyl diphosphate synthase [Marinicauda salina]PWE17243.1 di-trans,poly-cis-decaprenylcistransferase [Marinicauda salina]